MSRFFKEKQALLRLTYTAFRYFRAGRVYKGEARTGDTHIGRAMRKFHNAEYEVRRLGGMPPADKWVRRVQRARKLGATLARSKMN